MVVLGVILVVCGLLLMLTIIGAFPGVVLFVLGLLSMVVGALLRATRRN
jgi:hypothetical protein